MSELAEPNLCNNQNTSEWPGFENRWEHRLIDLSNPQGNKQTNKQNLAMAFGISVSSYANQKKDEGPFCTISRKIHTPSRK